MQIFQWLFRVTHDEQAEDNTSHHTNKKTTNDARTKDIILYKQGGVYRKRSSKRVKGSDHHHLGGDYFKPFTFLCRKDFAKACFCSPLNLRRPASLNIRQHCHCIHSMTNVTKEEIAKGLSSNHKADSANHAGSKVLPVSGATLSSSSTNASNEQCGTVAESKKDSNKLVKGDKTKTISRMKELFRWAAAAKSEKGSKFIGRKVFHFRNRSTLKAIPDDGRLSTESPKISFRWEVESCSTSSSVYSGTSMASSSKNSIDCNMLAASVSSTPFHHDINHNCAPRKGSWITTDSEFVVLEL